MASIEQIGTWRFAADRQYIDARVGKVIEPHYNGG
jgi:hypothetical protein